jgi:two-component system cell cycle response regulator
MSHDYANEPKNETTVTRVDMNNQEVPDGESCLIVFYGQNIGRRYFLNRSELILGRSDNAHIQVDQDSVSRNHARIVMAPGVTTRIQDLESTNGTFVNNRRVTDQALHDGDIVRVGQTIFKHLSGNNIETKYHEEIYRLTTIDGLTEIYNKRFFLEAIERELNRAVRYTRLLSLAMFDIDHFKQINDTYGHLAGDHVLRELSALMAQNVRRQDVLARYGGEEFAVIFPEVDEEGAKLVCEKLRTMTQEHSFTFNGKEIKVTISMGIYCFRGQDESTEGFIAQADKKLYAAKQAGRNCVMT